jgi:hypothetical protein
MSEVLAAPRWRILLTPRWIGWHLFAVAAVVATTWLGDWQFRRAESGNVLSWAYTFEWPIFAVFGVVFWIKTVRDELKPPDGDRQAPDIQLPAGIGSAVRIGTAAGSGAALGPGHGAADLAEGGPDSDDPLAETELAEYNAYLAKLSKEASGHGRWHGFR